MIQLRTIDASLRITIVTLIVGHTITVEAGSVRFQFQPLGPLPPNVYEFTFHQSNLSPSGCSIAGDYYMAGIFQGAWMSGSNFVPVEIPENHPRFYRTSLNSAINDSGLIAGRFVWRYDVEEHEYRYVQKLPSVVNHANTVAQAVAVSSDGAVLGGWTAISIFDEGAPNYVAAIWRPLSPGDPNSLYEGQALKALPGHNQSAVQDMSSDGKVLVGYSRNDGEGYFPLLVRWTPETSQEPQLLPTPTSPSLGQIIAKISPNGSEVVAARCHFFGGAYETCSALIASEHASAIPLDIRYPYAISDNRVVVALGGANNKLLIWASYLGGNRSLSEIVKYAGLSEAEATAWLARSTFDISADGRTLLGPGVDPDTGDQGLIKIQLPLPGDADDNERVNLTDFAALKNSYGDNGTALAADFDFDTMIDSSDFSVLLDHFGQEGLPPTLGTCFPE